MKTRISFDEMQSTVCKAFVRAGMPEEKAEICARIHTESSRDGVYSHGLNRVERFVEYIHKGWVDPHGTPELVNSMGNMEVYDGHLGPGILNAISCMDRATELAASHGMGMVSLRNTTHWMRGGTYGWQAAEKGFISMCWTNTESCMPVWGSRSSSIGNNPFIIGIPRAEGHIVLDMAMSQYSYGKLQVTRLAGQKLPYPGGFDDEGQLTDDPGTIEGTRRILPMGYWKGSGFAVMLDLLSALLSGGLTTAGVDKKNLGSCGSCCQIFIAIDPLKINDQAFIDEALTGTIEQLRNAVPASPDGKINYPGERSLQTREENSRLGIPVDESVWSKVKELADV